MSSVICVPLKFSFIVQVISCMNCFIRHRYNVWMRRTISHRGHKALWHECYAHMQTQVYTQKHRYVHLVAMLLHKNKYFSGTVHFPERGMNASHQQTVNNKGFLDMKPLSWSSVPTNVSAAPLCGCFRSSTLMWQSSKFTISESSWLG